MDGVRRIALVETTTVDASAGGAFEPSTVIRFQLGNHLGSAVLEVDQAGLVISYEEYHPYGTTAYHSGTGAAEVSLKRYRYTGKERDEETGLYYHGARYYAPWLGRWTAADPAGLIDGQQTLCLRTQWPNCNDRPHGPRGMEGGASRTVGNGVVETVARELHHLGTLRPREVNVRKTRAERNSGTGRGLSVLASLATLNPGTRIHRHLRRGSAAADKGDTLEDGCTPSERRA